MKREEMATIWGLVAIILILLVYTMQDLRLANHRLSLKVVLLEGRQADLVADVSMGVAAFTVQADVLLDEMYRAGGNKGSRPNRPLFKAPRPPDVAQEPRTPPKLKAIMGKKPEPAQRLSGLDFLGVAP